MERLKHYQSILLEELKNQQQQERSRAQKAQRVEARKRQAMFKERMKSQGMSISEQKERNKQVKSILYPQNSIFKGTWAAKMGRWYRRSDVQKQYRVEHNL